MIDADANALSWVNKVDYSYRFNEFLTLIGGLEIDFHKVNSENRSASAPETAYDKFRAENSWYAELETKMNLHWSTVFLLREVLINLEHKALLPLMRTSYQPDAEKPLIITASIAGNSHQPTLNDLYYIPGGNPNLRAEKGPQIDLGSSDDFMVGKNRIHAGISLFYSNIKDWIVWLPTFQGYWEPTNIAKVVSRGIEANVSIDGQCKTIRYNIIGNYAFTSTSDRSDGSSSFGRQLPYIPKHSANLNVHLSYKRCHLDWMWSYYSKRFTTTANSEETISDYLYPYFMNNLQAGIVIPTKTNRLIAECKVLNIFNEEYRTVLQRPMPGRNYQFILRYDF